ncbi:hypothetical protein [Shinella zoogloeoides]|uniref:hypothetical protein n=1 Tax=Shinella zoogloeoides TaxID=352475 RepID=UPI00273E0B3C|nr:hypothetical protein [Shinella zoogloeoides]WLR92154.1 hypothetical protein Q9316_17055 [Shinella zoogloeoides]
MEDMHADWMAQHDADALRMRKSAWRHLIVLVLIVGGFLAMALTATFLVLARL